MMLPRVIPCLLLSGGGIVKTIRFRSPKYVGDPINIVKILNDKEIDELFLLDIDATRRNKSPNFNYIKDVVSECFVPLGYGGGIRSLDDAERLFTLGVEKVCVNTSAVENPALIQQLANSFGSQAIVVSIDVRKGVFGKYQVRTHGGTKKTKQVLLDYVRKL